MATLVLGFGGTRRQVTFERNHGEQNGRTNRDVHKTEEDVEERCGRKPGRWHETLPKMGADDVSQGRHMGADNVGGRAEDSRGSDGGRAIEESDDRRRQG